jgi:uncharacterized protein
MPTRKNEETPSRNEDEYFARQDAELIKQMRAKLDQEREAEKRKQSLMKCPKCGGTLAEEDRGNVKVDVCGDCKGMFLDAGELELLQKMSKSGGNLFNNFFGPGKSARK